MLHSLAKVHTRRTIQKIEKFQVRAPESSRPGVPTHMSTPYCTYISTLAGSLAFPDGGFLPHCTEEKHFATRVQKLMGQNGNDSGTAPFKYADIQAFAYKPTEPETKPPTLKPAQGEVPEDLRRWAFDTSALKKVFEIRHRNSSSSNEAEPSPSKPHPKETSEEENLNPSGFPTDLFGKGSGAGKSSEETLEADCEWNEAAAAAFFGKPTQDATGTHHGREGSDDPKAREPAEQKHEPAEPAELAEPAEPADCNPTSHTTGEHEEPTSEPDNDPEQPGKAMNTDRTIPTFDSVKDIKALLCIADPWCGLVATGAKTWELRSTPTTKRH